MAGKRRGRKPKPAEDRDGNPLAWDAAGQQIGYDRRGHLKERPYAWNIRHPTGQYAVGGSNPTKYLGTDLDEAKAKLFSRLGWTHPLKRITAPSGPVPVHVVEEFRAHPELLEKDPMAPFGLMHQRVALLSRLKEAAAREFGEPIRTNDPLMALNERMRDYEPKHGHPPDDPMMLLLDQPTLLEWYRQTLQTHLEHHPDWLAELTGYEQFRKFKELKPPRPGQPLSKLGDIYRKAKNGDLTRSQERNLKRWDEFVKWLGARGVTTTEGVTKAHLKEWNDELWRLLKRGTRENGYVRDRMKAVLAIFREADEHSEYDDPHLERIVNREFRVLAVPAQSMANVERSRISSVHFEAALKACKTPLERCLLLLSANGCMKPADLSHLRREDLHLAPEDDRAPYYSGLRHKDRRQTEDHDRAIAQACMLWDRTIDAERSSNPVSGPAPFQKCVNRLHRSPFEVIRHEQAPPANRLLGSLCGESLPSQSGWVWGRLRVAGFGRSLTYMPIYGDKAETRA